MKFAEALAILEMEKSNEVDQGLSSAYRKAMKKYHPDVTKLDLEFALEMSKLVNEAYSFLHQNMGKWSIHDKGETNIAGQMADIYNAIKHLPHITIERVGVWLWVTIGKPTICINSQELSKFRKNVGAELKKFDFRYAPKKQKWSWHDESTPTFRKKKAWDWDRIVKTFGEETLETSPHTAVT